MRKLTKTWSEEENRRFIEAIDAGVSAERVGVIFKRTTTSVRARLLSSAQDFLPFWSASGL